jgi:hypothetical protein
MRPDGGAQSGHQFTAGFRIGMCVGLGQNLERPGLQRVTRQNRGRLVECLMGTWLAAAQIVVVHRGQIVVNQRVCVKHLNRRGDSRGTGFRHEEQLRRLHHEKGPKPFAAAKGRIAHSLDKPRLGAVDHGHQIVQRVFNDPRHAG